MTEYRFVIVIMLLLLTSCAGPKTETERYHRFAEDKQPGIGAVADLQREAIGALNQGSIQLAIDYLQRAIKIEPRNPVNWHYLAQTYWYSGNYGRCIDMVERSIGYSSTNETLDRANSALQKQCRDE